MDSPEDWVGGLRGYSRPSPTLTLRAPLKRAKSSGAGAFLGIASDSRRYWLKVPGNPQGNQVLANEVIAEELGRRLGAPVRERQLVRVSSDIANGWKDFPVRNITESLIAHASLSVESAIDDDALRYTKRGDNPRRQARLLGLWDLCLGDDEQWLYDTSSAFAIWSYDHGFWFTTGQGDWDSAILERLVDLDGSWSGPPRGLDPGELLRMADELAQLEPKDFLSVVSAVPVEWGVADRDLEGMAWFLHRRREAVGTRLRAMAARLRPSDERGTV